MKIHPMGTDHAKSKATRNDQPLRQPGSDRTFQQTSATFALLALQRQAGNRPVSRMLAVQRGGKLGDKGLVKLAPGIEGEVGIPGSLDKGASLYPPTRLGDSSVAAIKIPRHGTELQSKTNANIHDIGEKRWLWAQIPSLQLETPKAEVNKSAENTAIEERKTSNSNNAQVLAAVAGLVLKNQANRGSVRHKDVKDPLFPHDPRKEDVEQGGLGDCYLLAALASIAAMTPGKIRELIKDNDDGTVTVRFYKVVKAQGGTRKFGGVQYVTVRKSVAEVRTPVLGGRLYAEGKALWPALVEKAYAAWADHSLEALPEGFKGTYEGIASGTSDIPYEQILGVASEIREIKKTHSDTFIAPWEEKVHSPRDRQVDLQPNDTLASIAAAEGLTPDLIRQFNRDAWTAPIMKHAGGPDYVEFFDTLGDNDTIAGGKFTLSSGTPRPRPSVLKVPGPTADAECARLMPHMPPDDRKSWIGFLKSLQFGDWDKMAQAHQKITDDAKATGSKTGVNTLDFIQSQGRKAGLSEQGVAELVRYCTGFLEGERARPETYSNESIKLFTDIRSALQQGKMVSLGTQDWGKGGGNAGENVEAVEGIVSKHAFSVVDTVPSHTDTKANIAGQPLYVRLRNPWGRFGRQYSTDFTPKKTEEGEFNLEITDVRKYGNQIYITTMTIDDMMKGLKAQGGKSG